MNRSSFDPTRDYDQEEKDARIDDVNDRSTYEVLETIMFGADATTPDTGIKTIREKIAEAHQRRANGCTDMEAEYWRGVADGLQWYLGL